MTSLDIKFALLWYFRFRRQWICATEFQAWDVVAFTNKSFIEVEVKISKSDLWYGEAKKDKHSQYQKGLYPFSIPNKFYICVPEVLLDEARKWVEATNPNYGIIIYQGHYNVIIGKKAKMLKDGYDEGLKDQCMRRV